jgi:hypothetical protein
MASDPQRKQGKAAAAAASSSAAALPGARPYALRPLLHDVPLSADGNNDDVKINCVDYYGMRALQGPPLYATC